MSSHARRLVVEPEQDGFRLDNFLTALLPDHSRSQIQRLIKDGHLRGPGTPKPSSMVHTGQEFEKVSKDTERDYFMSAEEAKDYHLIDKVISHV